MKKLPGSIQLGLVIGTLIVSFLLVQSVGTYNASVYMACFLMLTLVSFFTSFEGINATLFYLFLLFFSYFVYSTCCYWFLHWVFPDQNLRYYNGTPRRVMDGHIIIAGLVAFVLSPLTVVFYHLKSKRHWGLEIALVFVVLMAFLVSEIFIDPTR